jgi:Lrp/AsnC family transcriptional regulator, leucine-responsive regulatory protein
MGRPPKKIQRGSTSAEGVAAEAERAEPKAALDRIDRALLRLLQANGRATNLELAEAVHLSPPACHDRVRRLHQRGLVMRYTAILDAAAIGAAMLVFTTVSLDRTTPDVFDRFKASIESHPEILEAHLVAGGFDYLLKIRVRDMRAYRDLIARTVWSISGVRETHTYVVMEEVKETTELAV